MHLTWALCHRGGAEKDFVWERVGGSVTLALNGQRTGIVTISSEESLAREVHPGRTRMKVWMHTGGEDPEKQLILNGLIIQPRANWDTTELPIVDQSHRLLNAHHARILRKNPVGDENEFEDEFDLPEEVEISQSMWNMIRDADRRTRQLNADYFDPDDPAPTMGIIEGDLADTGIEREWGLSDLRTTWDALQARARRKGGPDFELQPLDREDDIHARFNTFHPKQGTEQFDKVVLELGHNLSDIGWEPSIVDPGLCNRYMLVGQGRHSIAPVYVAENVGSINAFGLYSRIESTSDDVDLDELEARAKAYIQHRAWPVDFFDLVLPVEVGGTPVGYSRDALGNVVPIDGGDFAAPPQFGVDYWLGDYITVRVHDRFRFQLQLNQEENPDAPQTDFPCRVTEATLEEADADGNVVVSLIVQPDVDSANVTGYESFIYTDG